jgi:hypothetical protein
MEQLIKFIDFETSAGMRGRRLDPDTLSAWYNLSKPNNKVYGVTLSQNIQTDKKNVKIGKIAEDLCLFFTNDSGIKLRKSSKNIVFSNRGFIEYLFPECKQKASGKDRKIYTLIQVSNDVYLIKG